MKRQRALPPLLAARRQRQLEIGGVIVAERGRGARWDDLAEQFRLADARAARTLAVAYLLALTEPREAAQDGAGEAQGEAASDGSPAAERAKAAR